MNRLLSIGLMAGLALTGCGDSTGGSGGGDGGNGGSAAAGGDGGTGGDGGASGVPGTYTFERDDASTVKHTGQTTRQVLISDVIASMKEISSEVLAGNNLEDFDTAAEVYALLEPLVSLGGGADPSRALPSLVEDDDTMLQSTYADLNDANLQGKLAGNDDVTDWADWDGDGDDEDPGTNPPPAFQGWADDNLIVDDAGTTDNVATPAELLDALLWTFANQAARGALTDYPIDAVTPLYLTPEGHDLTQLVQKFLLGAVNFSQGTDDYLDDDVDGKGLLAANELREDSNDTALEHHWDEGYGYWGAAADYSAYDDDEIAGSGGRAEYEHGYFDTSDDGAIDLTSEFNFSASVNAAKRDRGSDATAPTDFTADADLAWRTGRYLIASAFDAGEAVDMVALGEQRDIIVETWEKAIAATAVHYINDVLEDMQKIEDGGYSFADHAKHWGELKGFALSFQFNPRSPTHDDFSTLHTLIGDAPVGASPDSPANDTDYRDDLLEARDLLGDAYDFEEANLAGW